MKKTMISLVCIVAVAWLSSCNESRTWKYVDDYPGDNVDCIDGFVIQNNDDKNAEDHNGGTWLYDEKGERIMCQADICEPGEFQCNNGGYSICGISGTFRMLQTCDEGLICSEIAGRCINPCVDDTFQCVNNSVMKCSNQLWNIVEECGSDTHCVLDNNVASCVTDSDKCTKDATKCGEGENANVLYTCGEDGKWSTAVSTNCAEDIEGKTLCGLDGDGEDAKYACIIDSDICTKDATKCGEGEDASTLYTCGEDGKWSTAVSTNCAENAEGKTLCGLNTDAGVDNAFAECKAPASCLDDNGVSVEHGKSVCINSDDYVGTRECSNGSWIDGDIQCNAGEVCSAFDGELGCFTPVNSVIGSACECLESGLCAWSVDSNDIKSLLLTNGNTHLQPLNSAINDDVNVSIPNFFPGVSNIVSSNENAVSTLDAQLEGSGLQVGCYRTSVINLSDISTSSKIKNAISTIVDSYKMSIVRKMQSEFANENGIENFNLDYAELTDSQKAEVDKYINDFIQDSLNYSFTDMLGMVNELAEKLLTDVEFHSEKGYLVAGAVHVNANPNGEIGRRVFDSSSQNYSKLEDQVKKLEAGDFEAAESLKKCPDGSTYISYKFDEEFVNTLALIGEVDINLAMCLKNCNSDYDCTEGNSCLDIPETISNGSASDSQVRVCFDKASIEYFKSLKNTIALESVPK